MGSIWSPTETCFKGLLTQNTLYRTRLFFFLLPNTIEGVHIDEKLHLKKKEAILGIFSLVKTNK